ncbi:male sterility protein [Pochonia chlamydosporia 170]|uniref:Fatty acyl-CoA reductase n=1 Tax=Pochonia chlamydosporia 170 TaxID=1380566 RepID=A0A179F454_METCM|nr:male sterility protein [Pochonia chlamydosporia 170]OAQ60185.1 male sterility protein [Pochonia chlamydosporia 170]
MSTDSFFSQQIIFLTGSTGHFGACLLYKLVLVLQVPRVYVLIRGTPGQAITSWVQQMPEHVPDLITSGKVLFVAGNLTQRNLGISEDNLATMSKVVTIIIHAAANISLKASLQDAVINNCLPSLELARLAASFNRLNSFVQVSSLFALSFLPDGPVDETLYMIDNPEEHLDRILTGSDNDFNGYAWPYAKSKHLTECLLATRYCDLPLMILRPSSIGPAIFQPFELYGKSKSIPIHNLYSRLMYPSDRPNLFHATAGSVSGSNVLDEIPVDLLANILLQNVQRGTRGPVNASSRFYITKTFDDFVADVHKWVPDYWKANVPLVEFTTDRNIQPCPISRFYQMGTRNWNFLSHDRQLDQSGPLAMSLEKHDAEDYTRKRVLKVFKETQGTLGQLYNRQRPRL